MSAAHNPSEVSLPPPPPHLLRRRPPAAQPGRLTRADPGLCLVFSTKPLEPYACSPLSPPHPAPGNRHRVGRMPRTHVAPCSAGTGTARGPAAAADFAPSTVAAPSSDSPPRLKRLGHELLQPLAAACRRARSTRETCSSRAAAAGALVDACACTCPGPGICRC